jgi:hypothetical protein
MKDTLFALLKFNALICIVCVLVVLFFEGVIPRGGRSSVEWLEVLLLGFLILFAVVANLRILWNGRRKMLASVESAVVEATAVAMSVGDKARARVEERAKERSP